MLLPAIKNAREKGRQAVCKSNLNQIAVASESYAIDYDDVWYGGINYGNQESWPEGFIPGCLQRVMWQRWLVHLGYLTFGDVWNCPSAPEDSGRADAEGKRWRGGGYPQGKQSYGINYWAFFGENHPRSRIEKPSLLWHVSDSESSWLTDDNLALYGGDVFRIYASNQFYTGQISDGHEGGSNILFSDGHVEWMKQGTIYPRRTSGPLKNDQYWGDYNSGL